VNKNNEEGARKKVFLKKGARKKVKNINFQKLSPPFFL